MSDTIKTSKTKPPGKLLKVRLLVQCTHNRRLIADKIIFATVGPRVIVGEEETVFSHHEILNVTPILI
jgi:hypothetical protein